MSKNGARLFKYFCLLISVILIIVLVIHLWNAQRETPDPKAEVQTVIAGWFKLTDAQWSNLSFQTVSQQTLYPTVKADGKIAENENTTALVFSPYFGRVTKLFAKVGDHLQAGDPLMAVAAPDFLNAIAKLKLATLNERRQHERFKAKTGALKDWQQAQAELETAQSNVFVAQTEIEAARRNMILAGKNDEEIASLDEGKAIITAPIRGRVIQRQVGLGQYINSASGGAETPAFSIGDFSTVWLLANVRENDAPRIHLGQKVEVQVLAYPNRKFKAEVVFVAPTIDPVTHRLPVRAEIENADEALKPGMFASFSIIAGNSTEGTAIPESSVIYEGSEAHVWIANPKNKSISVRYIKTGINNDGQIEVFSGLNEGEVIVASGSLFIDRIAKEEIQQSLSNIPQQDNEEQQNP